MAGRRDVAADQKQGGTGTSLSGSATGRTAAHRLEGCQYVAVPNDAQKTDGRWKIHGRNVVVYARAFPYPSGIASSQFAASSTSAPVRNVHEVHDLPSPSIRPFTARLSTHRRKA